MPSPTVAHPLEDEAHEIEQVASTSPSTPSSVPTAAAPTNISSTSISSLPKSTRPPSIASTTLTQPQPTPDALEAEEPIDDTASSTYPPSIASSTRPLAALPSADRGTAAYRFLLASFVVETVVWGVPSAYGVFLSFYQKEGVGANDDRAGAGLLPLVGSFSGGLMYLLGPPVALLLNPRPRWRIPFIRVGAVICTAALLLSAYAQTPWQLLLTQGLLYSIGGSMVYYPTFSFLNEWFVLRRGFANGVCFAGTAAGGLVYPFLMDWLLATRGAKVTLIVLSIVTGVLLGASMPILQPRIPVRSLSGPAGTSGRDHPTTRSSRRRAWRSKRLWVFLFANVAQAFGFFLTTLYLPTFAASLGLSGAEGSGLLACVNGTSVLSRVALGSLSDRISPHKLGAVTMLASSLAVIILWGVTSTSFVPLLVFSLVLGLVAGGWTSLYSSIVRDGSKDDPQLAATLFGLVSFTRGVGSLLTAPISTFLISHPMHGVSPKIGFGIAEGEYASLVVFAGVSMLLAAGMEVASVQVSS